ncbi:MAG: alpha/beta fold hydrolase [Halodesulfurarchaeum sp.]
MEPSTDPSTGDTRAVRTVEAENGRTVAWRSVGDPEGTPALFLHGTPGSAELASLYAEAAADRGVLIVAPDRPGYGDSPPWPDWQPRNAGVALAPVLDAIDVTAAPVIAFSGGAPFALGLAAERPARVASLTLVSAASPHGMGETLPRQLRLLGSLARAVPRLSGVAYWLQGALAGRRPAAAVDQLTTGDRSVEASIAETVGQDIQTGLAGSRAGAVAESRLFGKSWDLPLSDIEADTVLYHGTADTNAPLSGAAALAETLPNATLSRVAGADHLGTLTRTRAEVLERTVG